jgi:hypothetical protein
VDWFAALVDIRIARHATGGCPIGSLVPEHAEFDARAADARGVLRPLVAPAESFAIPSRWRVGGDLVHGLTL